MSGRKENFVCRLQNGYKCAPDKRYADRTSPRVQTSRTLFIKKSSHTTRCDDVLYREESDNTGRRVLSLSPVGASLFNRWLVTILCESAFHSRGSAHSQSCSKPWNRSLNVPLWMLCARNTGCKIADTKNFSRSSGGKCY